MSADGWHRSWPAPAKLNLFLHVVGRREDGYHLLQSAMRLIDCCDQVRFSPLRTSRIALAKPLQDVEESRELCVRAARLLQAQTGCQNGVEIRIDKNIPMGGGLGGGSSDAATTLMVLNRLWNLGLDRSRLMGLGLQLGADVPFFIFGQSAFAEGIGERLAPITLPAAWYLVLVPPVSVSTQEVFATLNLTQNTKSIKISSFSVGFGRNDLESAVCRRYPVVARYLGWLKAYGDARMSGSGACVFTEFSTEAQARAVASRLPPEMRGFVARGLERHPVEEGLDAG
ncbi:MAG: 4-(cytidine 5'-diphospho)-2-C-methyl-D-erythritol kinase [Betaproteobacteria bacterium]|nr:4-(cytidine 5'-diphospho)-2-C-methyl-D-erythritol kinase [Betaproteobacteria bacterium]